MESPPQHQAGALMAAGWTRYTTSGRAGKQRPTDHVELGPGDVDGLDRRLLGAVNERRVLELGTGAGQSAIALARQGARVIALDPDEKQIASARTAIDDADVHVELHNADHADLAFLRADHFDVVLSVHALAGVDNLGRVFRQVHRVLKPDGLLVFTLPHPATLAATRDQFGGEMTRGSGHSTTVERSISEVFTQLTRANFRVDTLLEPTDGGTHPVSLIMRGRKLGT